VVLEGLDHVEVRAFALRETVLAVELELGRDDGVLTPAVHVEGGLREHECASIRHVGAGGVAGLGAEGRLDGSTEAVGAVGPVTRGSNVGTGIRSAGHLEETRGGDEVVGASRLKGSAEGVDGVGKSIDGVRVVEGLGTEGLEENRGGLEGRAVVDVGIGLDDPDELLAGVVEVELDLVGGGSDGLVTRELNLLDEVFVGVLSHLAALVRVEEDIVDVERGGNEGLLVGSRH